MKQNIFAIGLLGVGLFAVSRLFRSPEQKQFDTNIDEIRNKPLPPGQPGPTITRAEALAIAERQYLAMTYWLGTDEDELYISLRGLNGSDLRLVYETFGRRNYYGLVRPLDLFQWYVNDLTRVELDAMRKIWAKSGLKF